MPKKPNIAKKSAHTERSEERARMTAKPLTEFTSAPLGDFFPLTVPKKKRNYKPQLQGSSTSAPKIDNWPADPEFRT